MVGCQRLLSKVRRTSELFFHRRSLQVFLRSAGFVGLLLALPFIFSSGLPLRSGFLSEYGKTYSSQFLQEQPQIAASSHVDIVLVIDNVGGIKAYNPAGARGLAAQMFVNQAQLGSSIGVVRVTSSDEPSPTMLFGPHNYSK